MLGRLKAYWFTMLAACGRIGFGPTDPAGDASDGDGSTVVDARVPCTGPFGAAQLVPNVNSVAQDWGGHLTEDRLELYFGSTRLGAPDLFVARRPTPTAPFDAPIRLDTLSTTSRDDNPFVSADGLTLWFDSNNDVMITTRATTSDAWGTAMPVPELNSADDDVAVALTADGLSIYVTSGRPGGAGGYDLWTARRSATDQPFPALVPTVPPNTSAFECCAYVAPGGTELWYTAGAGIRVIQRDAATGLTSGTPTTHTLNTPDNEIDVFGTIDGEVIGFSSDRLGGGGSYDLYLMERSCP